MHNARFSALLAVTLGACLLSATAAAADAPVFGGWRKLHSANGAEPMLQDLPFAALPQAAAKGARFAIFDRESRRVVCCLVVDSERLDAISLETRYRLPGVWIADLLGSEDYNARRGQPQVYAMKRDGALVDYAFSDALGAYSDLGGLLLPANATLDAAGAIVLGTDSYRLQFQSLPLADENGALDRYTLQPAAAGAAPVVVEVPFSTY